MMMNTRFPFFSPHYLNVGRTTVHCISMMMMMIVIIVGNELVNDDDDYDDYDDEPD